MLVLTSYRRASVLERLAWTDLEVLLPRALVLLGGVEARLARVDFLLQGLDGGVDGGDLSGQAGRLGLERGDAGVHALQVYECLELRVHYLSTRFATLLVSQLELRPLLLLKWWAHLDSNQDRTGYEPGALPIELWARGWRS